MMLSILELLDYVPRSMGGACCGGMVLAAVLIYLICWGSSAVDSHLGE